MKRINEYGDAEWFCKQCEIECFEAEYDNYDGLCSECEKERLEDEEFLKG